MATRQYIGARYVPKFFENPDGTNNWKEGYSYEALTIVQYNNNSYTSKKPVPAEIGNPYTNTEYWVLTGNYNGQVQAYKEEVDRISESFDDTVNKVEDLTKNIDTSLIRRLNLGQVLNVPVLNGLYSSTSTTNPCFCQSCCADQSYLYMLFMDPANEDLIRINKYSKGSKKLVASNVVAGGYHANSATLYNNSILVATIQGGIIEINCDSLQKVNTYIFGINNIRSVSYDSATSKLYAERYSELYEINLDNLTYTKKCTLNFNNTIQAGAVYNNELYEVIDSPKSIIVFNIDTGAFKRMYSIEDYYNVVPTGEIESLCINEYGAYLCSVTYMAYDNYRTGRMFEIDFEHDLVDTYALYRGGTINAISTLYVNSSVTDDGNPTGTSDNPFKTISQCLQILSSPYAKSLGITNISISNNCDEIVYIRNMNLKILGNNASISGIYSSTGIIYLSNLSINDTGNFLNACLTIEDCKVSLYNVKINTSRNSGGRISNSTLIVNNLDNAFTNSPITLYRCDTNIPVTANMENMFLPDYFSAFNFTISTGDTIPTNYVSMMKSSGQCFILVKGNYSGNQYSALIDLANTNAHRIYFGTSYIDISLTLSNAGLFTATVKASSGTASIFSCLVMFK